MPIPIRCLRGRASAPGVFRGGVWLLGADQEVGHRTRPVRLGDLLECHARGWAGPDWLRGRMPEAFFSKALNAMDPPEHTPIRKLIQRGFTRGRMKTMEARIAQIANELIAEFIDDGECDIVNRFCYGLSQRTILHLLGGAARRGGAVAADGRGPPTGPDRSHLPDPGDRAASTLGARHPDTRVFPRDRRSTARGAARGPHLALGHGHRRVRGAAIA